ncbi:MAG: hypothetical protein M3082_18950 [Candidatus Dormibacteraeota bacterium]|nr:hypothetical protein [Candidatus Dormibacteraeota bacterium]
MPQSFPWVEETFQRRVYPIEMSLRNVWACQRQINRFTEGLATRPTIIWDFPKGIVAPVDAQRTYDLYRSDGYLVAVLAQQARRWLLKAERELGSTPGTYDLQPAFVTQVEVLRNIYEHWDEHLDTFRAGSQKTRAGLDFVTANPNLKWPGDGWKWSIDEGASLDNLRLNDLFRDLSRVEASLLQVQRDLWASINLEVPDGDYKPLAEWEYFVGAVRVDDTMNELVSE